MLDKKKSFYTILLFVLLFYFGISGGIIFGAILAMCGEYPFVDKVKPNTTRNTFNNNFRNGANIRTLSDMPKTNTRS